MYGIMDCKARSEFGVLARFVIVEKKPTINNIYRIRYTSGKIINALNRLKFMFTARGNFSFNPQLIDHCHPKIIPITNTIIGMKIQKKLLISGGRLRVNELLKVLAILSMIASSKMKTPPTSKTKSCQCFAR